ncbi:MAG TPA: trypsin-like peptidase domain-containing protein, partial [Chthoniobacterales bacterium]|nr:trypsin-like peptidase domain-containing protein [Chthoniobacterales bacterium]
MIARAFEPLLLLHIVSSSRLSGMKGFRIFTFALLFAGSTLFGQQPAQQAPPPPQQQQPLPQQPMPQQPLPNGPGPEQPRPPGSRPTTPPQQNVVAVPVPIAPPQPNGPVQKSLVRITATEVAPDYRAPWNAGMLGRGIGAGFVIDGNRIMTNAHVVSNSRYLTVERDGDPNKYPAKVLFVAHDCDLALITVDSAFFKNMLPLKFGGIPELESTVSAYGYPIGGERMSVTTGIVSRIDFQLYTHSSIDQHLAIQISAQIN